MEQLSIFAQAVRDGERFLAGNNFLLARRAFETALAIQETPELLDRLALCVKEIKQKRDRSAAKETLDIAEQNPDLDARIVCLLQLGHYDQVLSFYDCHPPQEDRGYYYRGFAYAKQGQYPAALIQWAVINSHDCRFVQQCVQLIPFVCRSLSNVPVGPLHIASFQAMMVFLRNIPPSAWPPGTRTVQRLVLKALWQAERFSELGDLLPPLSPPLSLPLLGVYARLYFKAAGSAGWDMEKTLSLWLTAIHQDALLDALFALHLFPDIDRTALRERLWQQMERFLDRRTLLSPRLLTFWRLEKQMIRRLTLLPKGDGCPDIFPCTPGFALHYQQSASVLAFLQKHRSLLEDGSEGFQELCAYFSPWVSCLIRAEQGERETVLTAISSMERGALVDYCRQRIHWLCGIQHLLDGGKLAKKHLLSALPLLKAYPSYGDILVQWAFSDLDITACVALEGVLTLLHGQQVKVERLAEATAHVMGMKASYLLNNTADSAAAAAKILNKASFIYPNSVMVKTVRQQVRRREIYDQVDRALRKNQRAKAVQILLDNPDPEPREYFFETMAHWSTDLDGWEMSQQREALRGYHESCLQLDPNHPVTLLLAKNLQQLASV